MTATTAEDRSDSKSRSRSPKSPSIDEAAQQRLRNVNAAMSALTKKYGAGSVMRLGEGGPQVEIGAISTGCPSLDIATGCGGYPKGRVVEIYGPESSGKTTLTLHAIAACQAAGGVAAFIDAEHAMDPIYARKLGVDIDQLLISQPDFGEQALEICEQLVSSGGVDLVVVDSVAALVPRVELEGAMEDQQVGLQARLMSKALRKITGVANRHNTCVIFINQLRQKIGVTFGPSEVTTGGNALKFYASLRVDVRRIGKIADGDEAIGNRTRVKLVKNKLAAPFQKVEFDILFGKGISVSGDILDLGEAHGIVTRSGSWYSFGDTRLGQGRDNARKVLDEDPALMERLRVAVMAVVRPAGGPDPVAEA
jgi:recombination protein RecA